MSDEPKLNAENDDTDLQEASEVEKADVDLGQEMASHRDDPLVKAAGYAGKLGDQAPLYALSAGLLIVGFASRDRRLAGSAISMLAALGVADISKRLIKRLVSRTRPQVLLDDGRYETDAGGSDQKPKQAFPSGHMAGCVAVARALSRNYPGAGTVAGVAAVAIGASRVAKGAHWPLDVAGGAFIGLAAEAATHALLGMVARRRSGLSARSSRRDERRSAPLSWSAPFARALRHDWFEFERPSARTSGPLIAYDHAESLRLRPCR